MSNQSKKAQPPAQPSIDNIPETINELTEKSEELLTESLQALNQDEKPDLPTPENQEQIRCYRVTPFVLFEEGEALKEYRADNLLDLLQTACEDFNCLAFLLRNFNEDENVRGEWLQWFGRHMERPIEMLHRLLMVLGDFEPHTCEACQDS
ncbi:hypothetical protein C4J81_03815 [Deltaproteobacteria bacterium Smac51]|nr:hypothetical protein C4J81_03815 [Deltaproteobacteria bacterium Smac51]